MRQFRPAPFAFRFHFLVPGPATVAATPPAKVGDSRSKDLLASPNRERASEIERARESRGSWPLEESHAIELQYAYMIAGSTYV